MTIRQDDPVREAFSSCSSGHVPGAYYETTSEALRAFDAALDNFDYHLDYADTAGWSGDKGRHEVGIYFDSHEGVVVAGFAVISYYRMPSGRYEFIGYIT